MKRFIVVLVVLAALLGCGRNLSSPESRLWGKWKRTNLKNNVSWIYFYEHTDGAFGREVAMLSAAGVSAPTTFAKIEIKKSDKNIDQVTFLRTWGDGSRSEAVCELPPDGKSMTCVGKIPETFEYVGDQKYDGPEATAAGGDGTGLPQTLDSAPTPAASPPSAPATRIVGAIALGGVQATFEKQRAAGKVEVCAVDQTAEAAAARAGKAATPNPNPKKICAKVTGDRYELAVPAGAYMVSLAPLWCFHSDDDSVDATIIEIADGATVTADIKTCTE